LIDVSGNARVRNLTCCVQVVTFKELLNYEAEFKACLLRRRCTDSDAARLL